MSSLTMAVCIPTYERRDIVEDFLNNCYDAYTAAGIDLYFYDSSIGDETQSLIQDWLPKGRLYYVRMPSDMHPNTKAYRIFQGYGLEKAYDFVLLSSDGLQHKKDLISQTMECLDLKYDMVILDWISGRDRAGQSIDDLDEMMTLSAYHMASFGAVVLNTHTMLHDVDWASYEKRFLKEPLIPWSHVCYYFERAAELDGFHGFVLSLPFRSVRFSMYKKDSVWTESVFSYVCEGWVQVIEGLPERYIHKDKVIREFSRDYFFNSECFLQYRRRGLFSYGLCQKYWGVWKKVTPVSRLSLLAIALLPRKWLNRAYRLDFQKRLSQLKRFCASHSKIVIYGKGTQGYLYGKFLMDQHLKLDGFCVSHSVSEGEQFMGYPVRTFTKPEDGGGETGYIIGVASGNAPAVLATLQAAVPGDHFFLDLKLSNEIRYQYGYSFLVIK